MPFDTGLAGWIALHFGIGLLGTWLARRYALKRRLIDQPGERRSHATPMPRGGGISIVAAMFVALAWWGWRHPIDAMVAAAIGIGLGLVAGAGWLDDHRPVSPWLRLAIHAVASAGFASALYLDGHGALVVASGWLLPLVLVNVWNFMDGIDGIATTQAVIAAAALVLGSTSVVVAAFAMALMASSIGFLPFNFPRARIFLGDVGSGSLGYVVAVLAVLAMPRAGWAWWLFTLPLSPFILDASLTLSARMVRGERWWMPHVEHAYQRLARHSWGHVRVTCAYAAWSLVGLMLLWAMRPAGSTAIMAAVVAWHLTGAAVWMRLRKFGAS